MAYALVGTIGTVSLGAANTAVTPAWGTSENRTAKNLLICWVAVHGTATLPSTPGGWSIGVQKAGTSMSVTAYYRVATGTDAAPSIGAMGASTYIQAQLAEFSGGADGAPVANAGVGTAGTTSPIVATLGAIDPTNGTLVVVVGASFYSAAATETLTHTVTGGAATITASQNNSTSLARHYAFGRGPTTTHASADSDSFAQTTTSITGGAVGLVSFLLGPPVVSAPTAGSMTLTGATPTVSAAQTYAPTAASMTLTGATPSVTVTNNVTAQPTAASMTLTGATPSVLAPAVSLPTALGLTLTGATPVVLAPAISQPTALALTLTPATPAVLTPVVTVPGSVTMTLAGATPDVATPVVVLPTEVDLATTTSAPLIGAQLVFSAGSIALTGAVPSVTAPALSLPGSATLTATGAVPDVSAGGAEDVIPSPASLGLAGATPTVAVTDNVLSGVVPVPDGVGYGPPPPPLAEQLAAQDARLAADERAREASIAAIRNLMLPTPALEEEWLLGLVSDQEWMVAS